jgi:hypothetical protein
MHQLDASRKARIVSSQPFHEQGERVGYCAYLTETKLRVNLQGFNHFPLFSVGAGLSAAFITDHAKRVAQ